MSASKFYGSAVRPPQQFLLSYRFVIENGVPLNLLYNYLGLECDINLLTQGARYTADFSALAFNVSGVYTSTDPGMGIDPPSVHEYDV